MLMGDNWLKTIVRIVTPNALSTIIEVFSYYFINAMVTISAVIFLAGARTMVTMKQVGLNVAQTPYESGYVGVKGGMVVMVADDPGPISSQTEQDTRCFGQFPNFRSLIPVPRRRRMR